MRKETKESVARWRRGAVLGKVILACLAVVSVAGGLWLVHVISKPVSNRQLEASVRSALVKIDSDSGRRTLVMQLELENGTIVHSAGTSFEPPAVGAKIILRERVNALGFASYSWEGPARK